MNDDLKRLRELAEAVATRNRSVKRGHPKYSANVTSEEELALTNGVLWLIDAIEHVTRQRDHALRLGSAALDAADERLNRVIDERDDLQRKVGR